MDTTTEGERQDTVEFGDLNTQTEESGFSVENEPEYALFPQMLPSHQLSLSTRGIVLVGSITCLWHHDLCGATMRANHHHVTNHNNQHRNNTIGSSHYPALVHGFVLILLKEVPRRLLNTP